MPPVAVKASRKAPQPEELLAAALQIVRGEGLAGLSLRPLAELLGVSVTVLSNHYGTRADVVAAVCQAARDEDARQLDRWRAMLAELGGMPPLMAADLADAILDEMAGRFHALSLLYLETLHGSTLDASLHQAFEAWQAERQLFWRHFGERAGLSDALLECRWWDGYIVAELAYSVTLNTQTPYRMLRRLCLQRLFTGGVAANDHAPDGVLFGLLIAQMQQHGAAPQAAPLAGRSPEWSARAARICGMRLASQGVSGLTHRAVAAEVGIPHTTLSYRYPTQNDLVMAGLGAIAEHIMAAVDAPSLADVQRLRTEGDGQKLDLARANFAVAIAAARMPALMPFTENLRSRRGNNLSKVFRKYLPDTPGIDGLCNQVVSLGLTGVTVMSPAGEASENMVARAFAETAKWLHGAEGYSA